MEEEKLLLTQRDRDRLKVLHQVRKGQLTQRQAGEQLKLTDRWIRKLLLRMKEQGDRAVVHGLRGRPSTRRIEEKLEKRAMELVRGSTPILGRRWLASIWSGIRESRCAGRHCGNG
jgi:hypothetical protein